MDRYAAGIQGALVPRLDVLAPPRAAYGAGSAAADYVSQLLRAEVPALRTGELELVAAARRPGVLTKFAIRPAGDRPVPIQVGIGVDQLAPVRALLDGERLEVVRWHRAAPVYLAAALGLADVPPTTLWPALGAAQVVVGEIDVRGLAGWRGLNVVLAAALTGWRIRLEPVAGTPAWAQLVRAQQARRTLTATVLGAWSGGSGAVRLDVLGLHAVLRRPARLVEPGTELDVRVVRLDPDEGRILVAPASPAAGQLALF